MIIMVTTFYTVNTATKHKKISINDNVFIFFFIFIPLVLYQKTATTNCRKVKALEIFLQENCSASSVLITNTFKPASSLLGWLSKPHQQWHVSWLQDGSKSEASGFLGWCRDWDTERAGSGDDKDHLVSYKFETGAHHMIEYSICWVFNYYFLILCSFLSWQPKESSQS